MVKVRGVVSGLSPALSNWTRRRPAWKSATVGVPAAAVSVTLWVALSILKWMFPTSPLAVP
jgi:hypothetical protein